MRHGRLLAHCSLFAALFAGAAPALAQDPPDAPPPRPALRVYWTDADHPSGIYHVKSTATLTIMAENPTGEPQDLAGQIEFGPVEPPSSPEPPGANAPEPLPAAKPLSVTPIKPITLAAGAAARIPLTLAFTGAGVYQLILKSQTTATPITSAAGSPLQCIFAPRALGARGDISPWITPLPPAAPRSPGYLADFMNQTSIRRFLIDERFAADPDRGIALGFGASLGRSEDTPEISARAIDQFLREAAKSRAQLVLRVTVPVSPPASGKPGDDALTESLFERYINGALTHSNGSLTAIAIVPDGPVPDNRREFFRRLYLAAYQAGKHIDRNLILLGAGSASDTRDLLVAGPGPSLGSYVDALALSSAAEDPAIARASPGAPDDRPPPLWILPPATSTRWPPPPAALAAGAVVVPVPPPEVDRGATAQLLNGSVFLERIDVASDLPATPATDTAPSAARSVPSASSPFIALFQGDGYALAALAGPSAGTPLDALLPGLAQARTQIEPVSTAIPPPFPNLAVDDDSHSMRALDAAGNVLDCRKGDTLYLPIDNGMIYLIEGGSAEDLAGSLRPARRNYFPAFEVRALRDASGVHITLRNISAHDVAGKIRILHPTPPQPDSPQPIAILAESPFGALAPEKSLDIPLPAPADSAVAPGDTLVIEATLAGERAFIQRTAFRLP